MSSWTLADHSGDAAAADIPPPLLTGTDSPELYDADANLLAAATVAIQLGQPLLLTGEPGCGKSSFADHVAWRLGRRWRALRVDARSNMELRDVFYTYDDVGRFRDREEGRPEAYLTLVGLGEAILRASDPQKTERWRKALLPLRAGRGDTMHPQRDPMACTREVVLFDEIDKAPRDVPNDLLSQITPERISFRIPELNLAGEEPIEIVAQRDFQPIIICTSNSERSLPDAFLRRCAYHHIEAPTGERLRRIVDARVFGGLKRSDPLLRSIELLFEGIRSKEPRKKPGLAELISFAMALKAAGWAADRPLGREGWQHLASSTMLKTREDRQRADELLGTDVAA